MRARCSWQTERALCHISHESEMVAVLALLCDGKEWTNLRVSKFPLPGYLKHCLLLIGARKRKRTRLFIFYPLGDWGRSLSLYYIFLSFFYGYMYTRRAEWHREREREGRKKEFLSKLPRCHSSQVTGQAESGNQELPRLPPGAEAQALRLSCAGFQDSCAQGRIRSGAARTQMHWPGSTFSE